MIFKNSLSINSLIFKSCYFNHYKTLNVSNNATDEQIKISFLQLAKKYHPDFQSNQQNIQTNHEDFIKIKQAYDILKQPNSRHLYDMQNFPQNIQSQTQNFYFYRAQQFQQNHQRRREQQRRKINSMIKLILFLGLGLYCIHSIDFKSLFKPQSMHEIRRNNIIMKNQNIQDGPSVQQRRKQQYAQEIKDKKIYGVVVQLKVRGAGEQTTKAKEKRKLGITSIQGIQKQNNQKIDLINNGQQYM